MRLRKFTTQGLQSFREYLNALEHSPGDEPPRHLLEDAQMSQPVPLEADIEAVPLRDRLEAGTYLDGVIGQTAQGASVVKDKLLWAWLSLLFFDSTCPADAEGQRAPGKEERHIPLLGELWRYYRHLLLGPYLVYRAHSDKPERALCLLQGPVDKPGDLVGQIAARQELVTNPEVVELATRLYIDPSTRQPRRGSGSKVRGGVRRLADVLNQFDVTYDLYAMTADHLLGMLPQEFDRFSKAAKDWSPTE